MVQMKDRILQIMQHERLSPSKFADAIRIKSSAMSHYMTGRNDPSINVLIKIHEKYPYVNLEWLLTGNGEMAEGIIPSPNNLLFDENKTQATTPDLFSSATVNTLVPQTNLPLNTPVIPPKVQPVPENRRGIEVEKMQNTAKKTVPEQVIVQKIVTKQVSKIMLFYSDSTFETFTPEKSKKD
jgi:transcriptional regulator with XRE-family HTH domain